MIKDESFTIYDIRQRLDQKRHLHPYMDQIDFIAYVEDVEVLLAEIDRLSRKVERIERINEWR